MLVHRQNEFGAVTRTVEKTGDYTVFRGRWFKAFAEPIRDDARAHLWPDCPAIWYLSDHGDAAGWGLCEPLHVLDLPGVTASEEGRVLPFDVGCARTGYDATDAAEHALAQLESRATLGWIAGRIPSPWPKTTAPGYYAADLQPGFAGAYAAVNARALADAMSVGAVARLDYSRPPPRYETIRLDGEVMYRRDGCRLVPLDGPAGAWHFYKLDNDPPGITTTPDDSLPLFHPLRLRGRCRWTVLVTVGGVQFGGEAVAVDQPAARVAAWTWHDRRLALVARLEGEGVQVDMWPHALVWTDNECLECERWPGMRALPDDFPAVLRRLAEDARLVENLGGPDHMVVGEPGAYEVVCPKPACCASETCTRYIDKGAAETAARAADARGED